MNNNKKIIEVYDLTCVKNNIVCIDHVDFSLSQGEVVGILGNEQSGKTDFLKCLVGINPITSGQVIIKGKNIQEKNKSYVAPSIAIDPPKFYGYLSAYQNLKIFSNLYKNIDKQRILESLALFNLQSRTYDKTRKFPYSIKKKLSLAQAFLPNSNIILLDEPLKSLRGDEQYKVLNTITNLIKKNKLSAIITGRDVELLTNLCDRFIVLEEGRIVSEYEASSVRLFKDSKEYKFIKVSHPNYAGKLTIKEFGLNVKLNNNRLILETDDETIAKIIKLLTEKKISIFGAGQLRYKIDKMMASQNNGI